MWELRWVLLGLGALLVIGVYLWGRGLLRVPRDPGRLAARFSFLRRPLPDLRKRAEPAISVEEAADEGVTLDPSAQAPDIVVEHVAADPAPHPGAPEKIIALRFIPKADELRSEEVVLALRKAGLQHGRYGIFHRLAEEHGREPLFSVASLTEPGSFDLVRLSETTLPGMSFFLILPGPGDPVGRFDDMVQTARLLAVELDAELYDDGGSSWSIQRERYLREELIQYRHQFGQQVMPPQPARRLDRF